MMKKRHLIVFILGLIVNLFLVWFSWFKGDKHGYNRAKEEIRVKVNTDKKTLENHEKELENIHSESDSSAIRRLRENLGTS